MGDHPCVTFLLQPDGRHQPAARLGAVARIDIDMFAGQAFWTVIGETITCDFRPALLAGEIFDGALEFFGIHLNLSSRAKPRDLLSAFLGTN